MATKWTVVISDPYGEGPFAVLGPYNDHGAADGVKRELERLGLSDSFPIDICGVWTVADVQRDIIPRHCDICDAEDNGDIVDGLCNECGQIDEDGTGESDGCICDMEVLMATGCKCGGN